MTKKSASRGLHLVARPMAGVLPLLAALFLWAAGAAAQSCSADVQCPNGGRSYRGLRAVVLVPGQPPRGVKRDVHSGLGLRPHRAGVQERMQLLARAEVPLRAALRSAGVS